MKKAGVRNVDESGRIIIPTESGDELDFEEHTKDEVYVNDKSELVVISKLRQCIFCYGAKGLRVFRNEYVCSDCIKSIKSIKKLV